MHIVHNYGDNMLTDQECTLHLHTFVMYHMELLCMSIWSAGDSTHPQKTPALSSCMKVQKLTNAPQMLMQHWKNVPHLHS